MNLVDPKTCRHTTTAISVDLVFYDTTTASFTTDYADDPDDPAMHLRQYGHSKEGTWSTQVVVALAVTRDGIPVRSWVLPGNTSDVSTVERVRTDLRDWNLGRALFVADSGMNSEGNRSELARACGKYLLACRMANVAEIKREVLSKKGRYNVFDACKISLWRKSGSLKSKHDGPEDLSLRELEILGWVSKGLQNKEIAQKAFISTNTVKVHVRKILSKLNVQNRAQAIFKAKSLGILN